ncbi:MAG TPA: acetylxylan esterase [Gaiellaceae bacterium]|jgi:hypothetical protein
MTALRPHRALSAALAAALLAVLGGCGAHSHPAATTARTASTTTPQTVPPAGPPRLTFADSGGSLDYVDNGIVERHGTVEVRDVSYSSGGRRVAAYLVAPHDSKSLPAVVLVHGSGADRKELLARAVVLAAKGAVTLTITEPSSAHPPAPPTSNTELLTQTRQITEEDVVAVRRAADVLQSLPAVDPARIGYLGWSNGAKNGAFVAASDPRFKAFALLSAGADPVSAFVAAAPPSLRAAVKTVLGSVDPLRYIAFAKPGMVLLEDGKHDSTVPHQALVNFSKAAPKQTLVRWYPTDHALDDAAYAAAYAWLLKKLA